MTDSTLIRETMDATWVQAGVSFLTLVIAVGAAFSWYETLRSQGSDECVGAAIDFQSSIGRYLSLRENNSNFESAYDEAWSSLAKLKRALEIQKRYDNFPSRDISRNLDVFTNDKLAPTLRGELTHDTVITVNGSCGTIVNRIIDRLEPGLMIKALAWLRSKLRRRRRSGRPGPDSAENKTV